MSDFYKAELNADDCPVQMWDGNLTITMSDVNINTDLLETLTGGKPI